MADRPLKGIARTWARRTLDAGRVAVHVGRAGARVALDRGGPEGDETDEATADALTEQLDEMKGLFMKVGQMMSYLDGAMPPRAQKRLRKLLAEARPMDWGVVEAILVDAYGLPVDQFFESFEREPFAAASIGQVHRAVIGGRPVAVKVQYPEIARAIDIDLGNVKGLAVLGSLGTSVSGRDVWEEMRDRLREECDYRQEAGNQLRFREVFAADARVLIPDVLVPFVRERVLVTEFVGGAGFDRFVAEASQAERDEAGLLVYEFAFRSIFQHAAFNGDPHPGNYLFPGGGRVAFLDFGCVRTFDARFVANWKRIAHATLDRDDAAMRSAVRDAGLVGDERFDWAQHREILDYLYLPMVTPGFRFEKDYVKKTWEYLSTWKNRNYRYMALPREWVLVNRLQWGLYSVLADLRAGGDFGAVFRACLDADTHPIGKPPPIDAT
jgi:predicted unusual protein kinase regulating ubiquinone biosynthesis (AarF/ABC1/UbiB family)